ncbi:MAG: DUF4402 domain-containing protein [Novosphingobium sp.]
MNQRAILKHLCLAAAIGLSIQSAQAASGNSKTVSGTASATVLGPIVLTHQNGAALKFGKFASSGTAGTVTVNAAGVGSVSGGVTFVPGSVTSTDRFRVVGDANRQFSITTGNGTVTLGTSSMAFTTAPVVATATLPGSGVTFFDVRGTLSVNAGQPGGNYSGTYSVTVAYN